MGYRIQQKAKRLTCRQIDGLSRWNRRETVMWWAGVSVVALRWASARAGSLVLIACLCVRARFRERVSVPLPCSFSAVCLCCRAWETTWLCWILSLYLRSTRSLDPVPLFVLPHYTFEGFLLSLLILDFILALTLFLTAVRDLWQAEHGCLLKAGCSVTLFQVQFQYQRDY